MAKKTVRRKQVKKATRRKPASSTKKSAKRYLRGKRPVVPPWMKDLRKRKQPLSLAIEEGGEIAFWKYSFDGPHDYNLMVWHPEGDLDFGFDEPTRRERYGMDTSAFRRLCYRSKKTRLIEAMDGFGHDYMLEEGLPWRDTEEGLAEWLDARAVDECEEPPISDWDNQYRPGHLIYDALTPKERKLLGIRQGDAGGPASGGCMVTTVTCTLGDLNAIIRQKKLPFVVVEDKRSEKATKSVLRRN